MRKYDGNIKYLGHDKTHSPAGSPIILHRKNPSTYIAATGIRSLPLPLSITNYDIYWAHMNCTVLHTVDPAINREYPVPRVPEQTSNEASSHNNWWGDIWWGNKEGDWNNSGKEGVLDWGLERLLWGEIFLLTLKEKEKPMSSESEEGHSGWKEQHVQRPWGREDVGGGRCEREHGEPEG